MVQADGTNIFLELDRSKIIIYLQHQNKLREPLSVESICNTGPIAYQSI